MTRRGKGAAAIARSSRESLSVAIGVPAVRADVRPGAPSSAVGGCEREGGRTETRKLLDSESHISTILQLHMYGFSMTIC